MESIFADRIKAVPRSFIREILKVSLDPEIISFAGGLPNRKYFPVEQIRAATDKVFRKIGADALQYSNSEGLYELRSLIANRYKEKQGLDISPESILITNGSQQGLDLLGKVMVNAGDPVLIEDPGYLGAIQSLSVYRPSFQPIRVGQDGLDIEMLRERSSDTAKLLYTVPNFQNPSGVTYSNAVREQVAAIAEEYRFFVIEDDPYGDLRFKGEPKKSIYSYSPLQTILLGSFSKSVAPGFRIGWIVAPPEIYEKLLVAKQAADLHTSSLNQHILTRYLKDNTLDDHLEIIKDAYGLQCNTMIDMARQYLPKELNFIEPEGGMFLWGSLPDGYDAMALFEYAVREKVVFVPGIPFYTEGSGATTFRLSFSCTEPDVIESGMQRLAQAFSKYEQERELTLCGGA
jgi:2-aminoadipate transaminase